jgi:ribonuclease PH
MTAEGRLVEVQGTAEGSPFSRETLDQMLDLATQGITRLIQCQREALG